jgi:hemolysin III
MSLQKRILSHDYSNLEEIIHSVTHGLGVPLGVVGLVFLILRAVNLGTTWHLVSFIVYGVSLIILYLASSLYHGAPVGSLKDALHKFDRSAIYILIAGTYTPFLLNNLRSPLGWSLLVTIWGLTVFGLCISLGLIPKLKKFVVGLYVVMGWLVVVAIQQIIIKLDTLSLVLLVAGGLSYTIGVIFYLWRRLPYNHTIWHLFVLGGSISHYFSVMSLL